MVKDRMFALNHHNFFKYSGPARYGPRVRRVRPAHVPLSALEKEKERPSKRPFKLYFMKLLFLTYKL